MLKPWLYISLAAATVSVSACAHDQETSRNPTIAMTVNSWGRPVSAWSIGPDGEGEYRTPVESGGGKSADIPLITRRVSAGTAGYESIRATLQSVEPYSGKELTCENRITDQPYGELSWTEGEQKKVFNYNTGCLDPEAKKVFAAMRSAGDQMKAFGEKGAITSDEGSAPK